jgi:uncharacterized protein (DUF1501 family)
MPNRRSRRDLLADAARSLLLAGPGAAAFTGAPLLSALAGAPRRAAAQPGARDLHFVFAYFSGGWDILLGLDPRDPAVFTDEAAPSTLIEPAYGRLVGRPDANVVRDARTGLTFGPYIGELARHADRLAVVRGMSMETLTHETGRRRFITGKPPSGLLARGSSIATHLAAELGREAPVPNLTVQVETYNVDEPSFASGLSANGVPDLLRAFRPAYPALAPSSRHAVDALLADAAACRSSQRSPTWRAAEAARLKAAEMTTRDLAGLFDFTVDSPEMEALRDRYGFAGTSAGVRTAEAQAAMAAQAITGGVARCVSFTAASGLDTHFREWTTDQGPRQERGFNAVARLADDLARREYGETGRSWLEHTVILGFSEFSRTPLINARDGRDHSLTNACFVLGGEIKGGQVIGASSDVGMAPRPVDLATGRPAPGGEVVRPEHVLSVLLELAGVEPGRVDLRVRPLAALRA